MRSTKQKLQNRVALITGGRRIGQAVAEALATRGCDIVMTYRSSAGDLTELKKKCEQRFKVQCVLLKADVTNENDVTASVRQVEKKFGRLDILINMASHFQKLDFLKMRRRDFDAQIATDLTSAFLFSQAAVPLMKKRKWGRIINFSDWTAASNRPNYTQEGYLAYYVAKMGVIGLTEALALEVAKSGITVNAIAPGAMLPPKGLSKSGIKAIAKQTPLGRWGGGLPIAEAVLWLCQDGSYLTGETIRVNGGRHLA